MTGSRSAKMTGHYRVFSSPETVASTESYDAGTINLPGEFDPFGYIYRGIPLQLGPENVKLSQEALKRHMSLWGFDYYSDGAFRSVKGKPLDSVLSAEDCRTIDGADQITGNRSPATYLDPILQGAPVD